MPRDSRVIDAICRVVCLLGICARHPSVQSSEDRSILPLRNISSFDRGDPDLGGQESDETRTMSYYDGGYNGDVGDAADVFVKAAVEVKRFLPSLFNIKVVCCSALIYTLKIVGG